MAKWNEPSAQPAPAPQPKPRPAPKPSATPALGTRSGGAGAAGLREAGLKGQTIVILMTFNPPVFQVCGNNADHLLPKIGDCIRSMCLTERQVQALEKRGRKPKFERRTDVRSEEPVFELEMPSAYFDEVKQSAFQVELLNVMEAAAPNWRPFIGDVSYASGQSPLEESEGARHRMLQLGSGNRTEKAVKTSGKAHHLMCFTHQ